MIYKNYYWFFEKAISKAVCNKIIKHGEAKQLNIASIEDIGVDKKVTKKEKAYIEKSRKSQVRFMNDKWLYDIFTPYINTANKNAGWNYDLTWSESFQYTVYKKSNFYHWHQDTFPLPFKSSDPNFNGKIRKLSATVQLSSPDDYKGGEFELQPRMRTTANYKINVKEIKPRGSVLVFPSHLWHRVKPVTKGVRYSLVLWNLGYPFK